MEKFEPTTVSAKKHDALSFPTRKCEQLLISAAKSADLLDISKPTMYRIMKTPGFPSVKIGGRNLVSVEGLKKWVDAQVAENVGLCK